MAAFSSECSLKPLLYDPTATSDPPPNDVQFQFSETRETEDDYIDDDDDALSLSDLPIYTSSSGDSFASLNRCEYQEEASSVFEFFSGELGAGDRGSFRDDDAIVFCGKLIPVEHSVEVKSRCERESSEGDRKHKKQSALFSWKRFKTASFGKSASKKKLGEDKTIRKVEKMSSARKVSTMLTCPTKSRWYLFIFGQTRFPQAMTMDLSDLKNRQQRRRCSASPSGVTGGGGSGGGRGIWSLLKESVTSAGKTNANDVVRAVGCTSLV